MRAQKWQQSWPVYAVPLPAPLNKETSWPSKKIPCLSVQSGRTNILRSAFLARRCSSLHPEFQIPVQSRVTQIEVRMLDSELFSVCARSAVLRATFSVCH